MTVAVHEATAAHSNQPGFGAEPLPPIAGGMSVNTRSLRGPVTSHFWPSASRAVGALLARALAGSAEIAALRRSIALPMLGSFMIKPQSFCPVYMLPNVQLHATLAPLADKLHHRPPQLIVARIERSGGGDLIVVRHLPEPRTTPLP